MNIRTIIMLSAIGLGFARCLAGCLTDEMHKDVAGGLFAAQQNASIDACRADVKRKWSIDAGADAQEAGK
jgi:hypothetical protein